MVDEKKNDILPTHGITFLPSLIQYVALQAPHDATQRPGCSLMGVVGCRPKSRGEILLASTNPLEQPRVIPRYFSDAEGVDLAVMVK
jgi:hypothetical protein